MQQKFINLYMDIAIRISQMSHAIRLKVGSVIVKGNTILSYGWNGMPAGWDNCCEVRVWDTGSGGWLNPEEFESKYPYEDIHPESHELTRYGLKTRPEVLHSEMNALMKVAQSTESSSGASLFITHQPCIDCAKAIYQAGIISVYYKEKYRDNAGVTFLKQGGVHVYECNPDESIQD